MILHGKAKEDFIEWFGNKYMRSEIYFNDITTESYKNALIIEWLDTLRYKGRPMFEICFEFYWNLKISSQSFNDICIQSIEKANEIYNKSKLII